MAEKTFREQFPDLFKNKVVIYRPKGSADCKLFWKDQHSSDFVHFYPVGFDSTISYYDMRQGRASSRPSSNRFAIVRESEWRVRDSIPGGRRVIEDLKFDDLWGQDPLSETDPRLAEETYLAAKKEALSYVGDEGDEAIFDAVLRQNPLKDADGSLLQPNRFYDRQDELGRSDSGLVYVAFDKRKQQWLAFSPDIGLASDMQVSKDSIVGSKNLRPRSREVFPGTYKERKWIDEGGLLKYLAIKGLPIAS